MVQNVQAKELKFVQITDTNFSLDLDDTASELAATELKKLIKDINKDRSIDFVLFTGNNVKHPDKKEVSAFFRLANKLNKPYYVVIGNKEVLRYKRFTKKNFMHTAWWHNHNMRFKNSSYVFKPNKDFVFIVVDGANEMIPVPCGNYTPQVLDWLDKQLQKYENKKVVLVQHFPIVSPSDRPVYNPADADKYMHVINSYDNIIAVIAGHFNADKTTYKKGVYHIISPAFSAPSYRYKVFNIEYEPKYLFASPSEFVLTQDVKKMVEPVEEVQEVVEEIQEEIIPENNIDVNDIQTQAQESPKYGSFMEE